MAYSPQSPITPSSRRRRSSGFSISTLNKPAHSRKSSMHSINSLNTPYRPSSALDRSGDYGFGLDSAVPEGLDNLAAELAEEDWDEEETHSTSNEVGLADSTNGAIPSHDRHKSDSEEDDIDEAKIISRDLEDQMKLVETLSKQEVIEPNKNIDVFHRVRCQLQDLKSQANVETQASRLTNTVSLVSTHLTNELRNLYILLQPYVTPFAMPTDPEIVDTLQPLLSDLILSVPALPSTPLPAIQALGSSGTDILSSLAILSDNLYIAQQNTSLATQRLRSARQNVDTIRMELRLAEEGLQYLHVGGWEDKLRRRDAASVCRDVVGGFEEVCESWRRRLGEGSAMPA